MEADSGGRRLTGKAETGSGGKGIGRTKGLRVRREKPPYEEVGVYEGLENTCEGNWG